MHFRVLFLVIVATVLIQVQTGAETTVRWQFWDKGQLETADNQVLFSAYTEEEISPPAADSPDSLRLSVIQECRRLARLYADSLGQDVRIVVLRVKNNGYSRDQFQLRSNSEISLGHSDRTVETLGFIADIVVNPGQFKFAYAVFPAGEIHQKDIVTLVQRGGFYPIKKN